MTHYNFLERYLRSEFNNKTLLADRSLDENQQGVEIYGTHSVKVLVKNNLTNVHYKVVTNK